MTKPRPPLSFGLAMTKVAGLIGWPACVTICNRSEKTLRNWSDEDVEGGVRLDQARALDLAYRRAGGDGAPFLECYALSLDALTMAQAACSEKLARATSVVAKEAGEAVAALVDASRPGASRGTRERARREAEEAHNAIAAAISHLGPEDEG